MTLHDAQQDDEQAVLTRVTKDGDGRDRSWIGGASHRLYGVSGIEAA